MRAQSGLTWRSISRTLASGSLLAMLVASLLLTSCTREELASAMATVAVDLQATLVPLGATVAAGNIVARQATPIAAAATVPPLPTAHNTLAAAATTAPTPVATSAATSSPEPTSLPATATVQPSVTPEPSATSLPPTATVQPPATPEPSATPLPPTATVQPPATPEPSATPLPAELDSGGAVMLLVPGGFFRMGADAADMLAECAAVRAGCQADWFTASEPVHVLLIAPFYIDQSEVTNLAYLAFLNDPDTVADCSEGVCLDLEESQLEQSDAGVYQVASDLASHPMAGVTWAGADAYCAWRNSRLPTEAEWEKAALWNQADWRSAFYPWGDTFDGTRVNFCDVNCEAPQANREFDDGFAQAAPVGSLPDGRSPIGAYDMAGNVWEWVADWFGDTTYAGSTAANPQGPAEGTEKVVRGGSYFDTGNFTSGFVRFPSVPDNADRTIGFRCATSAP